VSRNEENTIQLPICPFRATIKRQPQTVFHFISKMSAQIYILRRWSIASPFQAVIAGAALETATTAIKLAVKCRSAIGCGRKDYIKQLTCNRALYNGV
jgi:hypothetical protein